MCLKTQECALNPQQHPFEAGSLFVPVPQDHLVAHLTAGDPEATERPVVFQVRPVTYNSPLLVKRPRPVMRTRAGTGSKSGLGPRTAPMLRSKNGSKTRVEYDTVPKMRASAGTGSKSGLWSRTAPKMRSKNESKSRPKQNIAPKMKARTGMGSKYGVGPRTVPKLRSGTGSRNGVKLSLHVPIPKKYASQI